MKSGLFIFLWMGIVSLIGGCIYSENDLYIVDPVAGNPPVVVATTNLDSVENPVVYDSLKVIYDISIQNGELYLMEALVGNLPVFESDTTQGSFWIYATDSELPGIDTLRINIYYSSNTNSLGDLLGLEALDLALRYPIDFTWNIQ